MQREILGCTRHEHRRRIGTPPAKLSWQAPLRKAAGNDPGGPGDTPDTDWLMEIADRASPAMRAAFLEAINRLRAGIQDEALTQAIARRDVNAAMRALGLDADARDAFQGLMRPLEDTVIHAGRETIPRTLGATIGMRFDLTNPKTQDFLRQYDFGLIRQISDDTREGIRRVIQDAFANGGHPYEQARTIRASIGLTDTQAAAVQNFRRLVETKDQRAFDRKLRDRRFDPSLTAAFDPDNERELTSEQVDRMVSRYRDRYINLRATTIARTETIRAANSAQHMAWGQAQQNGLLGNDVRTFWLVTPDDRLCEFCEAVPDMNQDGVPLGGLFKTDLGDVPFPPLHPACRCATYIGPAEDEG